VDALRTSFGHGKRRISSIYGHLYVSDAMYLMDAPMICFGHDKQHASGR
jgi:hypothetical protein